METVIQLANQYDARVLKRIRTFTTWRFVCWIICSNVGGLRTLASLGSIDGAPSISASAISQTRKKLGWGIFRRLLVAAHTCACQIIRPKTWHGYHIYAIDGSKFNVPEPLVRKKYKRPSPNSYYPQAMATILYNTHLGVPANAELCRHHSERLAAVKLRKSLGGKDVILYDRGYLSRDFLIDHHDSGVHFLMRCPKHTLDELNEFILSENDEAYIWVSDSPLRKSKKSKKSVLVRAIKYRIEDEEYYLVTSLLDSNISKDAIAKLYHERWGVEEGIKLLKRQAQSFQPHSKTPMGIKQEFFISLLCQLLAGLLVILAQKRPYPKKRKKQKNYKKKKQRQKPSGVTAGAIIRRSVHSFQGQNPTVAREWIRNVTYEMRKHTQHYQLDRHFERVSHKPIGKWQLAPKKQARQLQKLQQQGSSP